MFTFNHKGTFMCVCTLLIYSNYGLRRHDIATSIMDRLKEPVDIEALQTMRGICQCQVREKYTSDKNNQNNTGTFGSLGGI